MKRVFRVYGAEGHRQRESFSSSRVFKTWSGSKVLIRNADLTGTNEYSEVVISAKTNDEIISTLNGQIDDGIFENSRTGRVTEVINGAEIEMVRG